MASTKKNTTLRTLFASFLHEFYNEEDLPNLYIDSFLQQSIILPEVVTSVNSFIYNIADKYFIEGKNGKKQEKSGILQFFCDDLVGSIEIDEAIKNIQDDPEYKDISEKWIAASKDRDDAYQSMIDVRDAREEKIRERMRGENKRDINRAVKKFFMKNKPPAHLAAKFEESTKRAELYEQELILLEEKYGIGANTKAAVRAKLKCKHASDYEKKTAHNMAFADTLDDLGEFVPSMSSNTNLLEHVGKRVAQRLKIKDETIKDLSSKNNAKEDPTSHTADARDGKTDKDLINKVNKEYIKAKRDIQQNKKMKDEDKSSALKKLRQEWLDNSKLANAKEGRDGANKMQQKAIDTIKKLGDKAKDKFAELDKDEKFDECMNNDRFKAFSEKDIKTAKDSANIGGGDLIWSISAGFGKEKLEYSTTTTCISFETITKIPIRYSWLEKQLVQLDYDEGTLSLTEKGKNILKTPVYIIKYVIIGTNLKFYSNDEKVSEEASSFVAKASYDIFVKSAKGEAEHGTASISEELDKTGFNVPDYITVLGYELEQLSGINSDNTHDEL